MIENKTFKPGETIYCQGDIGSQLFFIKYGTVELFINEDEGEKKLISTATEGSVFGELGALENKPRSTTAIAKEETIVTAVDKDSLNEYLKTEPRKMIIIMQSLSYRIREKSQKLAKACQAVAAYAEEKEKKGEVSEELLSQLKAMAEEGRQN